jgi:hypothetical protein
MGWLSCTFHSGTLDASLTGASIPLLTLVQQTGKLQNAISRGFVNRRSSAITAPLANHILHCTISSA